MEKTMGLNQFVEQAPDAPLTRGQAYGMIAGIVQAFDAKFQEQNVAIAENKILMDELVGIIVDIGIMSKEEVHKRLEVKRNELMKILGGTTNATKNN